MENASGFYERLKKYIIKCCSFWFPMALRYTLVEAVDEEDLELVGGRPAVCRCCCGRIHRLRACMRHRVLFVRCIFSTSIYVLLLFLLFVVVHQARGLEVFFFLLLVLFCCCVRLRQNDEICRAFLARRGILSRYYGVAFLKRTTAL